MVSRLEAVRNAVARGEELAAEFHSGTMNIFEANNTVPIFKNVPVRMKKPKPSSFDAGNQTQFATKRIVIAKAPKDLTPFTQHLAASKREVIVRTGLIAQVSTPDGDPTLNEINFTVQSAINSQFSAEREITLATEINKTKRIT